LRVFFDPVRMATYLNSRVSASAPWGTTILTLDLALILLRSLAIPDRAMAVMT
jgi:hypothetical protein